MLPAIEEAIFAGVPVKYLCGINPGSLLNLVTMSDSIRTVEDLRGKTLAVDALDTAFALLMYEILRRKGLRHNVDYHVRSVGATRARLEAAIDQTRSAASIASARPVASIA